MVNNIISTISCYTWVSLCWRSSWYRHYHSNRAFLLGLDSLNNSTKRGKAALTLKQCQRWLEKSRLLLDREFIKKKVKILRNVSWKVVSWIVFTIQCLCPLRAAWGRHVVIWEKVFVFPVSRREKLAWSRGAATDYIVVIPLLNLHSYLLVF